jgi:hypothetical protein
MRRRDFENWNVSPEPAFKQRRFEFSRSISPSGGSSELKNGSAKPEADKVHTTMLAEEMI